jgi:MFS transporter, DHA1 family, tetracycline resistance protein
MNNDHENQKSQVLNKKMQLKQQEMEKDEKKTQEILNKYGVSKKKVLFAMMLSLFVDMLGYSMVLPLLPGIATIMGAGNFEIGIVIAANSFAALIFAPIWGKLSDNFGRKKLLMVNQIGTLVAFLILAFSNSFEMILIARLVDGIFGGQFPIIKSIASDITTHKTRMNTMTKIMMGVMLGMIIGPALGGLLGSFDWRYPAYLAVLLAFISFILTWKFQVETMPPERIANIKSMMKEKKISSKLWTKTFTIRIFEIFLINFAFIVISTSLPLVLSLRFAADSMEIGAVMMVNGIFMVLTMGIAVRKMEKRFSRKTLFYFSSILMLFAYFIYSFLSAYWMFFVFMAILTIGNAFARPLYQVGLLKAAPQDQQGAASGWGTNVQSIAESTAPLLAMWYLEIGGVSLGSLNLSGYTLLGITSFLILIILTITIIKDAKSNKDDF